MVEVKVKQVLVEEDLLLNEVNLQVKVKRLEDQRNILMIILLEIEITKRRNSNFYRKTTSRLFFCLKIILLKIKNCLKLENYVS